MLQSLIKSGPNENTCIQGPSGVALIHGFISVSLITHSMETFTDVIYMYISERSGITLTPLEHGDLSQDTFNQLCNSHTRWDGVRVDNNIWHDALTGERHIFLAISHADSTLLAVPRCLSSARNTKLKSNSTTRTMQRDSNR